MAAFEKTLLGIGTFYRRLPFIILTMMAGIFIAQKYLKYKTPLYESTAKIKLADTHEGVPNSNLFKDLDVFANTNKISAEVELLKSSALIGKILNKLDLGISIYRVGDIHKTELYNETPFFIHAEVSDHKWYDQNFSVTASYDSSLLITTPGGKKIHTSFNQLVDLNGVLLKFQKNDSLLRQRPTLPINDCYAFTIHSPERLIQ